MPLKNSVGTRTLSPNLSIRLGFLMPFPTGRRSAVQGEGSSGWRKPRTKSGQPIHRRGGSLSQINILVKHYTLGESWSKPFHGFRFTLGQGWLCLTGLFSSTILLWTCLDFIYRSLFLQDCDRESASNTAMAGYSLTGSVASSYLGHQRLEVKTLSQKIIVFILFC